MPILLIISYQHYYKHLRLNGFTLKALKIKILLEKMLGCFWVGRKINKPMGNNVENCHPI